MKNPPKKLKNELEDSKLKNRGGIEWIENREDEPGIEGGDNNSGVRIRGSEILERENEMREKIDRKKDREEMNNGEQRHNQKMKNKNTSICFFNFLLYFCLFLKNNLPKFVF
jgi:uncharacterized protein with von Willebrand factor type A (vWA) domain